MRDCKIARWQLVDLPWLDSRTRPQQTALAERLAACPGRPVALALAR
ncbi:hypothetical protein ACIOHS_02900 [Streptomyces sp. NPDC088253]